MFCTNKSICICKLLLCRCFLFLYIREKGGGFVKAASSVKLCYDPLLYSCKSFLRIGILDSECIAIYLELC